MDRSKLAVAWVAVLMLPLAGCGSGGSSPEAAGQKTDGVNAGPDKAVSKFLEAVRTGNDTAASALLTNVARQKTTEMQLVVAPPGSDTASFTVTEVELIGDQGAHVASTWTDIGDDGKPHTDTIVWMLRHEPEGWRISGMGTKIFDDEPPLLLNFEDPEDMIRKQRFAEEQIQRRTQQPASQAQKPAAAAAQR